MGAYDDSDLRGDYVEAYHCGGDIGYGQFSLKFLRTGEGWQGQMPLGDGIYFATDPEVARLYCKHAAQPVFYRVRISTRNMRRGEWSPETIQREGIWSAWTYVMRGESKEIAVYNPEEIQVVEKVYMQATERTKKTSSDPFGEPTYKIEKRGTLSDGTTLLGTPLRRIVGGYEPVYATPDGRFTVVCNKIEARDFEPAYTTWYWQDGDEDVHDHYNTKWEAVHALCGYILDHWLDK
ncbi:MAG: hypothetical protein ACO32I_06875 [Candidatus Limnocylindrus sp.]